MKNKLMLFIFSFIICFVITSPVVHAQEYPSIDNIKPVHPSDDPKAGLSKVATIYSERNGEIFFYVIYKEYGVPFAGYIKDYGTGFDEGKYWKFSFPPYKTWYAQGKVSTYLSDPSSIGYRKATGYPYEVTLPKGELLKVFASYDYINSVEYRDKDNKVVNGPFFQFPQPPAPPLVETVGIQELPARVVGVFHLVSYPSLIIFGLMLLILLIPRMMRSLMR